MSAIVAVLNKQAVALAADSAVTIGAGTTKTKIFNRANKLFTLSKFHPVGIMVYSSASFMATPWETIIKVYRKQLHDKSFRTLKEYQEDFIGFLRAKSFFTDDDTQKDFLFLFFDTVFSASLGDIVESNKHLTEIKNEENSRQLLELVTKAAIDITNDISNKKVYCDDFLDYSFDDFKAFSQEPFDIYVKKVFTDDGFVLSQEQRDAFLNLGYHFAKTKENFTNYSGLVFVGFGEDEIYPHLIPVNISFAIQTRLKYYVDETDVVAISNKMGGAVSPFAQQDVMDTILRGIDDNLNGCYNNNFATSIINQKEEIAVLVQATNPDLAERIRNLDSQKHAEEFMRNNNTAIRNAYIDPMITAVSQLSREDLAEMAESLIYLTYLKRRITFAEESVGGAVDVAIISKGDGFVWIKRKLYFDSKLNEHFIDNYLNK